MKRVLIYKLEITEEKYQELMSEMDEDFKKSREITENKFRDLNILTELLFLEKKIDELAKQQRKNESILEDKKMDVLYAQRNLLEAELRLVEEELEKVNQEIKYDVNDPSTLGKVLDLFEIKLLNKEIVNQR